MLYLLICLQDGDCTDLGVFDSIEEGRAFISQLSAYGKDDYDQEYLNPRQLGLYEEIDYKGHCFPFSRYMFPHSSMVDLYWIELPYLSGQGEGLVEGATRVDAYRVDNHDLQAYVEAREKRYEELKAEFENKGYDARREFLGSEDGEAMMIRASDEEDWHFYDHLDPNFFEL